MPLRRRPKVAKLARKNDVRRLVAALQYRDHVLDREGRLYDLGAAVRRDAASALMASADTDTGDVATALIRALDDSHAEVRRAAAAALSARRDAIAVIALTDAALRWDEPRFERARAAAVKALLSLSSRDSIGMVVDTVIEEPCDAERAETIIRGMAERGGEATARRGSDVAAAAMLREDDGVADRAANVLSWLGSASVEPLLRLLKEPGGARAAAIAALGHIGDLRASRPLVEFLDVDDAGIRSAAVTALGQIADPTSVQSLVAAAGDRDRTVRNAALDALKRVGPLAAVSNYEPQGAKRQLRPNGTSVRRGFRSSWFGS